MLIPVLTYSSETMEWDVKNRLKVQSGQMDDLIILLSVRRVSKMIRNVKNYMNEKKIRVN